MFRCCTLYMAIYVLNGVSSASSLFFEGVGGIEGRAYVLSRYVIGNKERKAAGTWENREKMEGNKDPPGRPSHVCGRPFAPHSLGCPFFSC